MLSPLLLVLALAVRLSSPGPVLFVQARCGLGGRKFRFYKFHTMVQDTEFRRRELEHLNEMNGPAFKIRRDPWITPLGGVLRKLSLDERRAASAMERAEGDMSLVGPRPPPPDEVARYTPRQVQRLSILLWACNGR